MGIFIYLKVSKSVTKEEWNRVYEESLELVKAFPLAERGRITYAGQQLVCAVRTEERELQARRIKHFIALCKTIFTQMSCRHIGKADL